MADDSISIPVDFTLDTRSAKELEEALKQIQSRSFSQALSQATSKLGGTVAGGIGGAAGALGKASGLSGFAGSLNPGNLTSLVGQNNPAVVEQFDRAWKDVYGVIGRSLTPVLKGIIPLVQTFGNALASLEPIIKPVAESIEYLFKKLSEAANDRSPQEGRKRGFAETIVNPVAAFEEFVKRNLSEGQKKLFDEAKAKKGGALADAYNAVTGARTGQGAGHAGAHYSSFFEAGQGQRMAAFGSAQSAEDKTAANTERMAAELLRVNGNLERLREGKRPTWNGKDDDDFEGGGGEF